MSEKTKKIKTYEDYKKIKGFASTGSLLLDLTVGGGEGLGFPFGKMINYVGDSSSGKTFLAWELLASNYYKYGKNLKWNYDDSESGNTFNTEHLYGVDLINHERHFNKQSDLVEEMDGNISLFLKEMRSVNQRGLYIVDSLDGLSDEDKEKQSKEFENSARTGKAKEGSGSYNTGTASHLSKQFFRTKTSKLEQKKVLLLIVSQVREKIGATSFAKKHYRAGGKAMDFYAHTCLWLYNVSKIKKNNKVIGVVVKCKAEKSKTPRPFRECMLSIYFDYGVDDMGTCLDYLYDLRGDSGELLKKAQEVPWDATTGIEYNWKNLQVWLKETSLYDRIREAKKEDTGKANLSKVWVEEYIENTPEIKEKAADYFASTITRDELISQMEEHATLYEELKRRVVEKWETEENAILPDRKRKYL